MTLLRINNRILKRNGTLLAGGEPPAPVLPPYTIRLKFTEGVTPTFSKGTGVQVSSSPNIWDLTYENSDWTSLLKNHTDLIEVLGANTSNVTLMGGSRAKGIFYNCTSLTNVCLFDTSAVTNTAQMFYGCSSLLEVPLYDLSSSTLASSMFYNCTSITTVPAFNMTNVTSAMSMFQGCSSLVNVGIFTIDNLHNLQGMFSGCTSLTAVPQVLYHVYNITTCSNLLNNCINIETGILDLYDYLVTLNIRIHSYAFTNCGSNTVTGTAELAQIPADWGGTMS